MAAFVFLPMLSVLLAVCQPVLPQAPVPPENSPPAANTRMTADQIVRMARDFTSRNSESPLLRGARQLVIAVNAERALPWARLLALERPGPDAPWTCVFGPWDVHVGKKGFSPFNRKKEGDLTTPTGLFPVGTAFGYEASADTRLDYRQAGPDDCWVDDPRSTDYNKWVNPAPPAGVSHEKMRRKDNLYRLGFVIRYNENPIVPGKGSAIFAHLRRTDRVGTAGCVAMLPPEFEKLLHWLDKTRNPVILTGMRKEVDTLGPADMSATNPEPQQENR